MHIEVTRDVIAAMQHTAETEHPSEACGILLGDGVRISGFAKTRNVHHNPETHFEIDPQALVDAHRAEREGGAIVMGYFHSHPAGDAHPSATDRTMAAHDGRVWAIVAREEVGFWRDGVEGFCALSYKVVDH